MPGFVALGATRMRGFHFFSRLRFLRLSEDFFVIFKLELRLSNVTFLIVCIE